MTLKEKIKIGCNNNIIAYNEDVFTAIKYMRHCLSVSFSEKLIKIHINTKAKQIIDHSSIWYKLRWLFNPIDIQYHYDMLESCFLSENCLFPKGMNNLIVGESDKNRIILGCYK